MRQGVVSAAELEQLWAEKKAAMQGDREEEMPPTPRPAAVSPAPVDGAAMRGRLRTILKALGTVPQGFELHPKLAAFVKKRAELLEGKGDVDWATAEALAFGTLLLEGIPVRLSGQDSGPRDVQPAPRDPLRRAHRAASTCRSTRWRRRRRASRCTTACSPNTR